MNLDHQQLDHLLATLADSDIQEFSLEGKDFRLEVKRNLLPAAGSSLVHSSTSANEATSVLSSQLVDPSAAAISNVPSSPSTPPPAVASSRGEFVEITAPMVGTFYRAPAPGEPVFVEIGARITVGQTVCILEAMKLMNELESEVNGEVVEILVENGTPVEFGQPLIKVKPS
ncbi:Biotin carboxyl carrier protein of acetyl-CoA carboxylase [Prochlorococcus sp. SS52]|uniref:Biotin carboxyl carrier protein of acetyl-CoA carboxylase n=2 Tax=Prochlorococcaceae TaxID=2881426 RepID=Q7VEI6_PROMA|nr:Biotin carboxyl carrier protein [Prochlorococcus marinus subsp. marinus str. CCMP1375]KGG11670.1 Biotin carboxyl carrier protein of acetyl-CoA carboxylase [Prochlorococcus marinus str. LG]KGG22321.1 Biotin carboxyl carrier protein of acetyl-CoA carboxylase [Prochlorococcus marinus str. SS2]KGG22658.1 Biotin carboxyl carrier protein of acetyl-CoA carboxylase [Prochlorococcus marinus str. SS35]KGG32921.1 Biotin carboxyl carrier protein of acetyl-CoA carboxylase [Prochlorococcus marinus str. SS